MPRTLKAIAEHMRADTLTYMAERDPDDVIGAWLWQLAERDRRGWCRPPEGATGPYPTTTPPRRRLTPRGRHHPRSPNHRGGRGRLVMSGDKAEPRPAMTRARLKLASPELGPGGVGWIRALGGVASFAERSGDRGV